MNPLVNPRYQCIQEIGQGSFGIVYKAYDTILKREVAIKKLIHHEDYELQSLQYLAHLSHPGLVRIIDVIKEKEAYFIIMDFIDGQNLLKWHDLGHTFSIKEGYVFLVEMLDVLAFLHHQAGLVYNDLKPENIQRLPNGHFVLLDFGTCFPISKQPSNRYGSKAYASTEYLEGKFVDGRSDLYSLAKTFLVLASKKTKRHYRRWLDKCLNYDPEKRYENVKIAKKRLSLYHIKKQVGLLFFICGCMLLLFSHSFKRKVYYYLINEKQYIQAIKLQPTEELAYLKYYEQLDRQAIYEFSYLDLSHLKNKDLIYELIHTSMQLKQWEYARHYMTYLDENTKKTYYEAMLIDDEKKLKQFFMEHAQMEGLVELMIQKLDLNQLENVQFIQQFNLNEAALESLYLQIFDLNILKELLKSQTNQELQAILEIQLFYSGEYQHHHLHNALNLTLDNERKKLVSDLIEQWGEYS